MLAVLGRTANDFFFQNQYDHGIKSVSAFLVESKLDVREGADKIKLILKLKLVISIVIFVLKGKSV